MDSKMKMVKGKDGKMVPSFANDGVGKMANGGMMKSKMKAGGGAMMSKMKAGGGVHKMPDGKMMKDSAMKKMNMGGMGYAKGGGVEAKGKTKGKMVKMNMGGKAC